MNAAAGLNWDLRADSRESDPRPDRAFLTGTQAASAVFPRPRGK